MRLAPLGRHLLVDVELGSRNGDDDDVEIR
jgi:hypothetical protein